MTLLSLVLIAGAVVLLGYGLLDGSNTYLVASILMSLLAALALVIASRRSGRAAVAAAVHAEEVARSRRVRQDELVGAGVGASSGAGTGSGGARTSTGSGADRQPAASDEYSDRDDVARYGHDTAVIDVGRRGVPAQTGYGSDDEPDEPRPVEPRPVEPRYDYVSDHSGSAARDGSGASYDDGYDDGFDDDDPPGEPAPQRVSAADAARVAQLNAEVLVIDGRPRYHLPGCDHLLGREHEPLPVSEAVELGFTPCGRCEPDSALLASARRV